MNIPMVTPILKKISETKDIITITFRYPGPMIPGQFFMIWVPGIDEIPMSVSSISSTFKSITFRDIGDATHSLSQLKTGDLIGVRGPYGNGFTIRGKNPLFIGGGTGIAMLAPAVQQANKRKITSTVILGAQSKNQLFFEDRFKEYGATVLVSTDDGSAGFKGFASEYAKEIIEKGRHDAVYTCGPEQMMYAILSCCKTIPFQASLERYMKCAIGLCGQCCIGQGLRVCVDGPIFDGGTLVRTKDFGIYQRDAAGRKIFFPQH